MDNWKRSSIKKEPPQKKVRSFLPSVFLFLGMSFLLFPLLALPGCSKMKGKVNVVTCRAVRGTFTHEVTGRGSVESAINTNVTCQVESQGGVLIIWIIPEGSTVEKGDELVILDSSSLQEKVNSQQISYNSSSATLAQSIANLRTAELELEEYIEGTFEQDWTDIKNSIYTARETQKTAAESLRFAERLLRYGYSTNSQFDAERVNEQKARNSYAAALLKQMVLLKYSSEKQITTLMAGIDTARAKVATDAYSNDLDRDRLEHYRIQLENCTIRAPQSGQVVYANQQNGRWVNESEIIKEGTSVRERQILIKLPDPSQMQVRALINEGSISFVQTDMSAKIQFEAFTSQQFNGTVTKVNQYAESNWMSSTKEYVAIVKIDHMPEGLRSGLTAQVRILVDRQENVLMVPVQCILENGNRKYCLTYREGVWGYKEVLTGATNDKNIIILAGLDEGEEIVNGAREFKDQIKLPDPDQASPLDEKRKELGLDAVKKTSDEDDFEGAVIPPKSENNAVGEMPGGRNSEGGFPGGMPGGMPGRMPEGGFPGGMPGGMPGRMPEGGFPGGMPGGMNPDDSKDESEKVPKKDEKSGLTEEEKNAINENLKEYFNMTAMEMCRECDKNETKKILKENMPEKLQKYFEQWDTSENKELSRTEFVIGFCTLRNEVQTMDTGTLAGAEEDKTAGFMNLPASEIFEKYDVDKDGFLTAEDFPADVKPMFSMIDSDQDEKVSSEELEEVLANMKKMRSVSSGGSRSGGGRSGGGPR